MNADSAQGRTSFRSWLWQKPSSADATTKTRLRTFCRIIAIFLREFDRDAIPLRASALTFTIILSMVPVLALSTAVLKGLGAGNQMRAAAYHFIDTLDPPESAPTTAPPATTAAPGPNAPKSLSSHLKKAVDTVFNYVEKTNFATIGMFGIAGLFFTVISVLSTIEQAMNVVWQTDSGRPLGRKVMDYLALMLLLPLAVNIGVATMAALQSETTLDILRHIFPMEWAGPLLVQVLSFAFLVMTLLFPYRFLPNTRVPLYPALIGALVGAIGWLLIQALYISLQIGVARYNAIYGSFATLPLFFLWIYIGWMVFLSGAEVAYAVHVRHRYLPGQYKTRLAPAMELALAYDLLTLVYEDFRARKVSDLDSLCRRLDYPDQPITNIIRKLLETGLIRQADGSEIAYLPATAAELLSASEVLDVILGAERPASRGGEITDQALAGARKALGEKAMDTLAG
ncbi:MAG: YihY/virulence factor BrkB family protein [Desulfobulbaceae bacterium]|nr:YihY/virulence factor BrkB family protein [Desulfobulbaceae bacterium]